MAAYYNEFDTNAAAWLRELIARGLIAPGDVDTRSIVDVRPDDLAGYTQCHFFAGIGVWSHALRGAGWDDGRPVWTGSCPCQPFSAAGKGAGFDDARHLWPNFFELIRECRPDVVLGEQVASKDGLGWLDLVHADLEGADYAVGAVDTCAAGFVAPHIRQRLWWVGRREGVEHPTSDGRLERRTEPSGWRAAGGRVVVSVAQPHHTLGRADVPAGHDTAGADAGRAQGAGDAGAGGGLCGLADACRGADQLQPGGVPVEKGADGHGGSNRHRRGVSADTMGLDRPDADLTHPIPAPVAHANQPDRLDDDHGDRAGQEVGGVYQRHAQPDGGDLRPGPTNGIWSAADWLHCRDGRWRPVEPGTFPLAHGASARVGRLRGFGNAIVAPQAQAFVEAVMEAVS